MHSSKVFPFECPAHSPGLNGCNYWLWGHLKANVYTPPHVNLTQLKEKISSLINNISQDMLKIETEFLVLRAQISFGNNGEHMDPKYN